MRILIVGAGIAGLALAALLRRQGKMPVIVDRMPPAADLGYALALWPQGTRVLHAIGVHEAFVARSEPMLRYALKDGRGRLVGTYDMQSSIGRFDHLGVVSRPDFIALLVGALDGAEIRHGVDVENIRHSGECVEVQLSDGTRTCCDLAVGADGIHSRVRELLYGKLPEWDTGWGCLVWWGGARIAAEGTTTEHWGAGCFLGLYPCRDRLGIFLGAPIDLLQSQRNRIEQVKTLLTPWDLPLDDLLAGLPGSDEPLYLWRMADVRAPRWVEGRVALLGDAAAAFLPTAGIGASMALESAAVLADVLSRTDSTHVPDALELYVERRSARVLAAQIQSRRLARLVFIQSRPLARLRDWAMRFVSMEQMIGPLISQLREPI